MKPRLIKLLDSIVGRFFCYLIPRPLPVGNNKISKILLIRPGGIGDAVLLASVIHSIKTSTPDIHVTILAECRNSGTFSMIPGAHDVLRYDRPGEFMQALLRRYDAVIDTEQWYRLSAVVARLVRAPIKIGFDTNERQRMFTHSISYDLGAYETYNFFALLKPLIANYRRDTEVITLTLPPESVSIAGQLLQSLSSDTFIVFFSGASVYEKRWGAERFSLVSKRLSECGYKIVVVGGREDREDGDKIAGADGLNLAGITTLAETAAVIARSSLVISGDSGVLHLAVGLNIPTVSLFGPGNVSKWAPRGEKHVILNHNLSCSPCTRFGSLPPCPNGIVCMSEITPDEVTEASILQLSKNTNHLLDNQA